MYYENNVYGTLNLCKAMQANGVTNIVFSSSATVYGDPTELPLHENLPTGSPTNPYGMSKLMVELMLTDLYKAENNWNIVLLRYFNPAGAHPSGRIGEDPNGIPNNLMPFITQVATGKRLNRRRVKKSLIRLPLAEVVMSLLVMLTLSWRQRHWAGQRKKV